MKTNYKLLIIFLIIINIFQSYSIILLLKKDKNTEEFSFSGIIGTTHSAYDSAIDMEKIREKISSKENYIKLKEFVDINNKTNKIFRMDYPWSEFKGVCPLSVYKYDNKNIGVLEQKIYLPLVTKQNIDNVKHIITLNKKFEIIGVDEIPLMITEMNNCVFTYPRGEYTLIEYDNSLWLVHFSKSFFKKDINTIIPLENQEQLPDLKQNEILDFIINYPPFSEEYFS